MIPRKMIQEHMKRFKQIYIIEKTGLSKQAIWRFEKGEGTSHKTHERLSDFLQDECASLKEIF